MSISAKQKRLNNLARHPEGQCQPECARVHGNASHYQAGCRCPRCREAHRDYRRAAWRLGTSDRRPAWKRDELARLSGA